MITETYDLEISLKHDIVCFLFYIYSLFLPVNKFTRGAKIYCHILAQLSTIKWMKIHRKSDIYSFCLLLVSNNLTPPVNLFVWGCLNRKETGKLVAEREIVWKTYGIKTRESMDDRNKEHFLLTYSVVNFGPTRRMLPLGILITEDECG